MELTTQQEIFEEAIATRNVKFLCKYWFNFDLTKGQIKIVRRIAYTERKRISINAYTRYGKTRCVAMAVAIYIILNVNKKIAILAPQAEQTSILREYIADCIMSCEILRQLIDINKQKDVFSMKQEASKGRQTFKNGCEYRVFSAYGEAYRLMGFGANLIIKDEASLIGREASSKIGRMLGDDPENSVLVEITNPWDKDTIAYDHYINPEWEQITIDYKQGIEEGRTTEKFVMEMKGELAPLQFTVLYESRYPEESDDSLFKWQWILKAREKFKNAPDVTKYIAKTFLGCDIAEAGIDSTVVTYGVQTSLDEYYIKEIHQWHKADTMQTVTEIIKIQNRVNANTIKVDAIGVGKGVGDRLRELKYPVTLIKVGESATRDKHLYSNQKAQFYWHLRNLFESGRIAIPDNRFLLKELNLMKYEITSGGSIRIVDPEVKSPDFCFTGDTLVKTPSGQKQIKDLQIGEYVVTPFGNRKILNKSCREVDEILEIKTNSGNLKTTKQHKLFNGKLFKPANKLDYNDNLVRYCYWSLIEWKLKRWLYTREKNTGFRKLVNIITMMSIMGQGKMAEQKKPYIGKYGRILTKRKYLQGLLSTIKTKIHSIINPKILRLLKGENINQNTCSLRKEGINQENTSKNMQDQRLLNGINQKKVENGIKDIGLNQLVNLKTKNMFINVLSVIKSLILQGLIKLNIAPRNVEILEIKKIEKQTKVYNITVEQDGVYYANNLLVSNCDSLMLACAVGSGVKILV